MTEKQPGTTTEDLADGARVDAVTVLNQPADVVYRDRCGGFLGIAVDWRPDAVDAVDADTRALRTQLAAELIQQGWSDSGTALVDGWYYITVRPSAGSDA